MAEIVYPPENTAALGYRLFCRYCRQIFIANSPRGRYCTLFCSFWARVLEPNSMGCCLWSEGVDTTGYPHISFRGRKYGAAVVCRMLHGIPTNPKLDVMHSCHVRNCVTLEHILRQGTRSENMQDSVKAGHPVGRPRVWPR